MLDLQTGSARCPLQHTTVSFHRVCVSVGPFHVCRGQAACRTRQQEASEGQRAEISPLERWQKVGRVL